MEDLYDKFRDFLQDTFQGMLEEAKEVFSQKKVKTKQITNEENEFYGIKAMIKQKGVDFGQVNTFISKKVSFDTRDYRHKLVFGATGSGKTEWAKNYAARKGQGICYIDNSDGEAIKDIINSSEQTNNIILLDHSDKKHPLPVGQVVSTGDIFQDDIIVNQWVDFFITNFGLGDQFMTQELITNACKAVFGVEDTTILDIVYLVKNENYRHSILRQLNQIYYEDVLNYWERFENLSNKQKQQTTASFLRRAGVLFRDRFLKYTLGQIPKKKLEYKKWMDEGKIVLINVPETLGKQAVRIIVSLHVLGFWRAALSRDNISQSERVPFNVIADEPQSWLSNNTDIVDDIFSKARKYHLGFICLFQSVQQVKKESSKLLDIMLDNEPDIIAFKTTENQLKQLGIKPVELKEFHFIFKSRGYYFTVKALPPIKSTHNHYKVVRRQNKQFYNKNYKKVEKEIKRRKSKWLNMEGRKSKSQRNGSKTFVNPDSPKEIEKSSDSYLIID